MSRHRAQLRRIALTLGIMAVAAIPPETGAGTASDVRVRSFELLNQGVAAYNRGDFNLAVEKLRASSAIALNSFRAHYYLGLALIGNRDYAAALESLEVALDLDPKHLQSLVAYGDAWLKRGDTGEARAAYTRALELRPAHPPALDGMGRAHEAVGQDEQAISLYRQSIASNKGYAPAYTHLGDLFLRLGQVEDAVRLLEEAIEVRPDYAEGLNRLSMAYGQLGLHNEAVATIQEAIELEPANAVHWATKGRLQLGRGFVTGAEQSLHRALELQAGMPEALAGLAWVAYVRGDYERALSEFDAAMADPRVDPALSRRLATFRATIQEERDQVLALGARLADGTASPADHSRLAEIDAKRGLWGEAADHQRAAGEAPAARERLAYLLFKAGRYREAHEIYASLEAAGAVDVSRTLNLGVTLARLGDDEAAAAAYRRVIALAPDHRQASIYLGNSLLRLGRRSEAAEAYQRALAADVEDEAAERVRRILSQIAPERVAPEPALPAAAGGGASAR
jgi:tetratricopeptide (TPR) repeat protein